MKRITTVLYCPDLLQRRKIIGEEKQVFLSNRNFHVEITYIWTDVPFEKKTQFCLTKRALTYCLREEKFRYSTKAIVTAYTSGRFLITA